MDVRPGYKQTEVGVIPDDWEVRAYLGSVACEIAAGLRPSVNGAATASIDYVRDRIPLRPIYVDTSATIDGLCGIANGNLQVWPQIVTFCISREVHRQSANGMSRIMKAQHGLCDWPAFMMSHADQSVDDHSLSRYA